MGASKRKRRLFSDNTNDPNSDSEREKDEEDARRRSKRRILEQSVFNMTWIAAAVSSAVATAYTGYMFEVMMIVTMTAASEKLLDLRSYGRYMYEGELVNRSISLQHCVNLETCLRTRR